MNQLLTLVPLATTTKRLHRHFSRMFHIYMDSPHTVTLVWPPATEQHVEFVMILMRMG